MDQRETIAAGGLGEPPGLLFRSHSPRNIALHQAQAPLLFLLYVVSVGSDLPHHPGEHVYFLADAVGAGLPIPWTVLERPLLLVDVQVPRMNLPQPQRSEELLERTIVLPVVPFRSL